MSATFSPELVDATIFVIDVAEGDKIPRKGGPGITRSCPPVMINNESILRPMWAQTWELMRRQFLKKCAVTDHFCLLTSVKAKMWIK